MRHSFARQGFTLIELLVVIAIIAVLAAILFPVFAQARAKARQAACSANLKQIGLAFQMYAQDYDEMLPIWGYSLVAGPKPEDGPQEWFFTWDTVLQPYMKNQQILLCPGNRYSRTARGYAMTRYTGDVYGTNWPCMIDYIPYPAKTVLVTDKGHQAPGVNGDAAIEHFMQCKGSTYSGQDWAADASLRKMPHSNGKNFLYVDGHVKFHAVGSGPFGYLSPGPCPLGGQAHPAYESHIAGHCEFYTDWPQE